MSAIYNPIILNTKNAFNLGGMSGPVVKSTLTPFQGACIWGCLFVLSATLHSAESAITKISPWKVRFAFNASSHYCHAIYCNQMVFPSFFTYHFDYINPNTDQLIIKFFSSLSLPQHFCPLDAIDMSIYSICASLFTNASSCLLGVTSPVPFPVPSYWYSSITVTSSSSIITSLLFISYLYSIF